MSRYDAPGQCGGKVDARANSSLKGVQASTPVADNARTIAASGQLRLVANDRY